MYSKMLPQKEKKHREEKQVKLLATFPAGIINDVFVAQSCLSSQATTCQRNIVISYSLLFSSIQENTLIHRLSSNFGVSLCSERQMWCFFDEADKGIYNFYFFASLLDWMKLFIPSWWQLASQTAIYIKLHFQS